MVKLHSKDELLCGECCAARSQGSYCPVCRQCYEDEDYDLAMMECSKCAGWVHAKCEGMDGEKYQVLSLLPDTVKYVCKCNGASNSSSSIVRQSSQYSEPLSKKIQS